MTLEVDTIKNVIKTFRDKEFKHEYNNINFNFKIEEVFWKTFKTHYSKVELDSV